MAIEETIENKAQEVAFAGGRVALRTTWKIARFLLACGWTITKNGVKLTADQIDKHLNSGLMSEKRLQRQGEDIHTTTIPAEALKRLAPSMRRAGLDYSIDINDDNTVTLYFKGKDADHITHAVERALKDAGLEASQLKDGEPDQPVPTQAMDGTPWTTHPAPAPRWSTPTHPPPPMPHDSRPPARANQRNRARARTSSPRSNRRRPGASTPNTSSIRHPNAPSNRPGPPRTGADADRPERNHHE